MSDDSATPTVERFRALARSSPWLWSGLEFERTNRAEPDHVWIERPDRLRVETADGVVKADRPDAVRGPGESWRWPVDVSPVLVDGLVQRRPADTDVDYDAPYYENYHWVAMLDPVELADCWDDSEDTPPVGLADLAVVDHHGRAAWQASATSTARYDPRCSCCALLDGVFDYDEQRWRPGAASVVRLDAETGLCVFVEHLGGARAGIELDVRILAARR